MSGPSPSPSPGSEETVQMSVRVPASLAHAIELVARYEDRTVSQELRRLIRRHVESHPATKSGGLDA